MMDESPVPDRYLLCKKNDIPADAAKGYQLNTRQGQIAVFIVRKNNQYFCFKNSCPHTGVNLDWKPDQFLDLDHLYIQCATHGAKFRINDGYCIYGPCTGQSLTKQNLYIEDDMIYFIESRHL